MLRQQLLELDQVLQSADVGHAVSASGGKGMADDLVVPEIHVQGKFMVNAFYTEGGHVAHNALQRSVDLHFGQKKIGEHPVWIARLLVLVMLCLALDACDPAAFMCIRVREDEPGVQANLGIQPSVPM